MKPFEHTAASSKSFDDAVAAVVAITADKGFRVLHVHDVAATLAEKGFTRDPLKIIEICNARYASEVLKRDIRVALMLPCPISVYVDAGRTYISTLLPGMIADFFPGTGMDEVAARVEKAVLEIVEEAS